MEELYYIHSKEQGTCDGHLVWWAPSRAGYTPDLDQAGKYSKEDASEICQGSYDNGASMHPCSEVDRASARGVTNFYFSEYVGWKGDENE